MYDTHLAEIKRIATACYPYECCGLIVKTSTGEQVVQCANAATDKANSFIISAQDYANCEDLGDVLCVFHSHCDVIEPIFSPRDVATCNNMGNDWLLVTWPDVGTNLRHPKIGDIPLKGREFVHGVLDCFALIRDYYKQELNIILPDFERKDDWWFTDEELYLNNYAKAGFSPIDGEPHLHDVVLMQVSAPRVNHAGVLVENNRMLHHMYGKLSGETIYGGYWRERTRLILRHKDLL